MATNTKDNRSIFDDPCLKTLGRPVSHDGVTLFMTYEEIENNLFNLVGPTNPGKIALEERASITLLEEHTVGADFYPVYRYDSMMNLERFPCFFLEDSTEVRYLGSGASKGVVVDTELFKRLAGDHSRKGDYLLLNKDTKEEVKVSLPFSFFPSKTTTLNWTLVNLLYGLGRKFGFKFVGCSGRNPWREIPDFSQYLEDFETGLDLLVDVRERELDKHTECVNPDLMEQERKEIKANLLSCTSYEIERQENTPLMKSLKEWFKHPQVRGRVVYIDFNELGVTIQSGLLIEDWEKACLVNQTRK